MTLALTTTSAHANWWEGGYDCACGDDPAGEYGNTDSDGNSWTDVTNGGTNPDPYGGSSTGGTSGSTGGTSGDNGMDDFTRSPSSTGGGESPEDTAYNNMPKEDPDSVTVAEELARNPQAADIMDPNETMDFMKMMNGDNFMAGGVANPVADPNSVIGVADQCTSCDRTQRDIVLNQAYFLDVFGRQGMGQLPSLSTGPVDLAKNQGLRHKGFGLLAQDSSLETLMDSKVRSGQWGVLMGGQAIDTFINDPQVTDVSKLGQKRSVTVFMTSRDYNLYASKGVSSIGIANTSKYYQGGIVAINLDRFNSSGTFSGPHMDVALPDVTDENIREVLNHEYSHAGEIAIANHYREVERSGASMTAAETEAYEAAVNSIYERALYDMDPNMITGNEVSLDALAANPPDYTLQITEINAFTTTSSNLVGSGINKKGAAAWRDLMMKDYSLTKQEAELALVEIVKSKTLYDNYTKPLNDGASALMGKPSSMPSTNPYSTYTDLAVQQMLFN